MTDLSRPALVDRLRAAGCVFAEDEADLLLQAATGDRLRSLLERRVTGEPLEQVVGWARFSGLRIAVQPGVFVPRRRSEWLVEQAVGLAPAAAVVVELCCGTGAVACALADRLPDAEVHAADIDPAAVRCARGNLAGRGQVHEGDLDAPLPAALLARVDLLVANAPYVPTGEVALMPREARLHEPLVALDGGPDGVALHRRIAALAPRWLAPAGHLLVETSRQQAPLTVQAFVANGLSARVSADDERAATVVVGQRR